MSDNRYTVTFKAAQMGADYLDKGKLKIHQQDICGMYYNGMMKNQKVLVLSL